MYKTMIPPENLLLYLRVTIQIIIHFLGLFKENFLVNFDIFLWSLLGVKVLLTDAFTWVITLSVHEVVREKYRSV